MSDDVDPMPEQADNDRNHRIAAEFHRLADRIAEFGGDLPDNISLAFTWLNFSETNTVKVDALAEHMIGQQGATTQDSGTWRHEAKDKRNDVRLWIYTYVPAPVEEDPAALKARIAELEARLAEGGGQV